MYLRPCRNCHKLHNCKRKEDMHRSIKGLYITSVKFKCREFESFFEIGQRVSVLLGLRFEFFDDEKEVYATVSRISKDGKVLVYFDKDPFWSSYLDKGSKNLFCWFWPKHLRKVNGRRSVCKCGLPTGEKAMSDWYCDGCRPMTVEVQEKDYSDIF